MARNDDFNTNNHSEFYNDRKPQRTLCYMSPTDFEKKLIPERLAKRTITPKNGSNLFANSKLATTTGGTYWTTRLNTIFGKS